MIHASPCLFGDTNALTKHVALRISPLSSIDPLVPNFTSGIEVKVHKRVSLGFELSVYTPYNYYSRAYYQQSAGKELMFNYSGFIYRPSARIYMPFRLSKRYFFIEPDMMFKHLQASTYVWIQRNVRSGVPSFFEYAPMNVYKDVICANLKFGQQLWLNKKQSFFFEYYLGAGLRQVEQHADIPKQDKLLSNFGHGKSNYFFILRGDFEEDIKYVVPSVSFGFRLGYYLF